MLLTSTNKILTAPIIVTLLIICNIPVKPMVSQCQLTLKVVHAGGGNATSPLVDFVPQQVGIRAGESIIWDNPTTEQNRIL
jgi:hypothetical protein